MKTLLSAFLLAITSQAAIASGCMPGRSAIYTRPALESQTANVCYRCEGFPRICKFVDEESVTYLLESVRDEETLPQHGDCAQVDLRLVNAIERSEDGCEEDPPTYRDGVLRSFDYRGNRFYRYIPAT